MSLQTELNDFNKKYRFIISIINDNSLLNEANNKIVFSYLNDERFNNFLHSCLSEEALSEFYSIFKEFRSISYYSCHTSSMRFGKTIESFLLIMFNDKPCGFFDTNTNNVYIASNKNKKILLEEKEKIKRENEYYKKQQQQIADKTDYHKQKDFLHKFGEWLFRADNAADAIKKIKLIDEKIIKNNETLSFIDNKLIEISSVSSSKDMEIQKFLKLIKDRLNINKIIEIDNELINNDLILNYTYLNSIAARYEI